MATELQIIDADLKAKGDQVRVALTSGQCASYEDYRFLCGQLRGIEYARDSIKQYIDLQERHNNE